jgi:hypothetical protein
MELRLSSYKFLTRIPRTPRPTVTAYRSSINDHLSRRVNPNWFAENSLDAGFAGIDRACVAVHREGHGQCRMRQRERACRIILPIGVSTFVLAGDPIRCTLVTKVPCSR